MRKIIVAGNWKMNLDFDEAKSLYQGLLSEDLTSDKLHSVLIFPSFPYLYPLLEMGSKEKLQIGSQNISSSEAGAYTGEVSAGMLSSMGIGYTLIGHSERRALFHEDSATLKDKVDRALEQNLKVVFCCGEQLDDRKAGNQEDIVGAQLRESLFHLTQDQMKEVIIAYEPVWAIGTGETASSVQAEEMHAFIRNLLVEHFSENTAENTYILYGGSCKSENSKELFSMPNVDGGLIGGASLKLEEFLKIISQLND